MEISLNHRAVKNRHPFSNANVVSTNTTGHNDLKYSETFSEKPDYVGTHSN